MIGRTISHYRALILSTALFDALAADARDAQRTVTLHSARSFILLMAFPTGPTNAEAGRTDQDSLNAAV